MVPKIVKEKQKILEQHNQNLVQRVLKVKKVPQKVVPKIAEIQTKTEAQFGVTTTIWANPDI